MLITVTGSLTIRSCQQFCQASAPTTLMPDATLTQRRRGTAAQAPSGIFSSGFMGTWIASGMSRSGHSSKLSFVGRTSQQSQNTTEYSVLCCSFSQTGLSKWVCVSACKKSIAHPKTLRSVTEARYHHMIFEVLKAIKFGNAHGDVHDCAERVVSTRWNSLTGSHAWEEPPSEELEDSMVGNWGRSLVEPKNPPVPCTICADWLSCTAPGRGTCFLSLIAHHLRIECFGVRSIPAPGSVKAHTLFPGPFPFPSWLN